LASDQLDPRLQDNLAAMKHAQAHLDTDMRAAKMNETHGSCRAMLGAFAPCRSDSDRKVDCQITEQAVL